MRKKIVIWATIAAPLVVIVYLQERDFKALLFAAALVLAIALPDCVQPIERFLLAHRRSMLFAGLLVVAGALAATVLLATPVASVYRTQWTEQFFIGVLVLGLGIAGWPRIITSTEEKNARRQRFADHMKALRAQPVWRRTIVVLFSLVAVAVFGLLLFLPRYYVYEHFGLAGAGLALVLVLACMLWVLRFA